ncbi:helix-turn-helix transcriptional regulator [Streptosporangium sp. NPDC003464]
MDHNAELREFLRSRRARLSPQQAGVPATGGTRRVPGLRREELARLAGVSVDYYTRLEQGRHVNVSESVLDAVARALRLDGVERAYLFELGRSAPRPTRRRTPARPQRVRPGLHRILEALAGVAPALILGRRTDVLAANRLARALITDFDALPQRERNLTRHMFLDEAARDLYLDWDTVAAETVAALRLDAGRHPDDPQLAELVGELAVKSEEFRTWWADRNLRERTHGTRRYHHPVVGELVLSYESVVFPGDADQTMCVHTTEPGSPSETALRLLADWTAPQPPAVRPSTTGLRPPVRAPGT